VCFPWTLQPLTGECCSLIYLQVGGRIFSWTTINGFQRVPFIRLYVKGYADQLTLPVSHCLSVQRPKIANICFLNMQHLFLEEATIFLFSKANTNENQMEERTASTPKNTYRANPQIWDALSIERDNKTYMALKALLIIWWIYECRPTTRDHAQTD
jgi:hypothetical protein